MNTVQLCLVVVLTLTSATRYVNALTYRELLELPEGNVEDVIDTFEDIPGDDVADDVDTMVIRDLDADVDERYMYLMYKLAEEMMESGEIDISDPTGLQDLQGPCRCRRGSCRCCASKRFSVKIFWHKISKTLGVCVSVAYLRKNKGFEFKLQFNGRTVFRREISLKRPPMLCYGVPGFKLARVCAQIYNVNLRRKSLCVRAVGVVDIKVKKFRVRLRIACFRIPFMDETMLEWIDDSQNQPELLEMNQLPVMRKEEFKELTQEEFEDLDLD